MILRSHELHAERNDEVDRRLRALISFLETPQGERVLVAATRDNLAFKTMQYARLSEEAERDVARERELIEIKMPELKATSKVQGDQDNWLIFESISRKYMEARDRAAVFDAIRQRAEARLASIPDGAPPSGVSAPLVSALRQLHEFRSQPHVVGTLVDIIGGFLKNPALIRTKFLNFMMVGAAGTGKTTLAGVMATCLSRAGFFVGDRVVTAGRAEFVAEYEGQTVARTRNFLVSNLDCGVIFVDEAYGITVWTDGKPESYGTEAVTAMVEFMTRFKGLYCLILAGYEREMRRYFLTTNPGLERRFPYRFVLRDMSPMQLVHVFRRTLVTEQGRDPTDDAVRDEAESYFSEDAWKYLQTLITFATNGTVKVAEEEFDRATNRTYNDTVRFVPDYPLLYTLFRNQAGSMTNLAEECVTVLMSQVPFGDATRRPRVVNCSGGFPRNQSVRIMQQVVRQRILNSALSSAPYFLQELADVERRSGVW